MALDRTKQLIHFVYLADHPGPEKRIRVRKRQSVLTLEQENENNEKQSKKRKKSLKVKMKEKRALNRDLSDFLLAEVITGMAPWGTSASCHFVINRNTGRIQKDGGVSEEA